MNILRNIAHRSGSTTKYFSVHYNRNVGFAAGPETVTLPTAGNQGYLQASIPMKYQYQTIAITDVALQASKKSKEFLVNVLESEYTGAKNDMQRQLSREGYSDGTGVICRVNDASPDATLTFDTPMTGKNTTDFFDVGSAVCFASATDGSTSSAFTTISAVTGDNTMTVSSASGVADNDYVFLAHTNGTTPTVNNATYEMIGLKGLIDDGTNVDTLEGLARSSYPWWKSYNNDNATQRSLTDALLHDTFIQAQKKGTPKYILTSWDVVSAYGQLLTPDRRYTSAMELNGGFKGVDFNGLPMVADYDAPYDEAYFIDPSVISVEDLAPISFLQEDGAILSRSSTTPTWNATLRYYANLAISAPNKCAVLRDVIK